MSESTSQSTDEETENSTPTTEANTDSQSEAASATPTDSASQTTGADTETTGSESGDDSESATQSETATGSDGESESGSGNTTQSQHGFNAVIESSTLRKTIKAVSVLVDECKLHIEDRHVQIRAVDHANVGMVEIQIDAAAFESYQAGGELIGLNLKRFEDIVSMADSGELVSLDLDQETRTLEIAFGGLEFTLGLINPETMREEPEIPELDLPAAVTLEGSDLSRAETAADMVSDHAVLGVDEETESFYVKAEGDTDDVHLELTGDDLVDISAGDAESLFSLEYLSDMAKPIPKNTAATLALGTEFPVRIEYELADGSVTIVDLLAPRIKTD